MRVVDLIEQHDNAPTRERCGPPKYVPEVGLGEGFDGYRQPLMDRAFGEERRKILAAEHAYRLPIAASYCGRSGDQRPCLLLVPGERDQPVPTPVRIGERCGHRMTTIDPAFGGGASASRTG